MQKNPDILATVAALNLDLFTVGFAAETEHLISYAQQKLNQKKLDLIIANDVSDQSIGMGSDNNRVSVISSTTQIDIPMQSKTSLARLLVQQIAQHYFQLKD